MATPKSKAKKSTSKKVAGKTENKMERVRAMMARASGCTRAQILQLAGWRAVSPQAIAEAAGLKIKVEKVEGKATIYRTTA